MSQQYQERLRQVKPRRANGIKRTGEADASRHTSQISRWQVLPHMLYLDQSKQLHFDETAVHTAGGVENVHYKVFAMGVIHGLVRATRVRTNNVCEHHWHRDGRPGLRGPQGAD